MTELVLFSRYLPSFGVNCKIIQPVFCRIFSVATWWLPVFTTAYSGRCCCNWCCPPNWGRWSRQTILKSRSRENWKCTTGTPMNAFLCHLSRLATADLNFIITNCSVNTYTWISVVLSKYCTISFYHFQFFTWYSEVEEEMEKDEELEQR